MTLEISSPAFAHDGPVPRAHTCDGADLSPPLTFANVPNGTKSLALIMDDPDAPGGTFVHWVLYGLPPDVGTLPSGFPKEPDVKDPVTARQGTNGFRKVGYGGPCPPPGPAHRYFFKLYALSDDPDVPAKATKEVLLKAIENKIVAEALLVGTYGRSET